MNTITDLNEQLHLLENTLAAVLSSSLDSIVVLSKQHRILCFNDTAQHVISENGLNLTAGADFREMMLKDNLEIYQNAFNAALTGETVIVERANHLNGVDRWMRHKVSPVLDRNGNITAVALASRSIAREKRIERAFTFSETRFQKIFASVAHPMLLVNEGGVIKLCNRATSKVFGHGMENLTGKPLSVLLPEYNAVLDELAAKKPGKDRTTVFCKGVHMDGRVIELEIEVSGVQDEEPFALISAEDITERVENQKKLAKFNHELSLLNYINDVILSASEENHLLQNVCDAIISRGGYRLAWFSLGTDALPESGIIPVNFSAGESGYVEGITLNMRAPELGPTGRSIRDGGTIVTNNVSAANYFKPWLERAQKFGIQSSIAIGVQLTNNTRGSLNIYSKQIDAFDPHEVEILKRVADNLSLAIRTRRTEKEKQNAQYALGERIKELRTLYDVNNILHDEIHSIHEVFSRVADILPAGWQFPEKAVARILFDGVEHTSKNFRTPVTTQCSTFRTQDNKTGAIEIGYTELLPEEAEGPFLREERNLIDALAEMIGVHYNERAAHIELRKSEANLKSVFDSTEVGYILTDAEMNTISFNHAMESGYALNTGLVLKTGKKLIEQVIPEKRKRFSVVAEQVKQEQRPVSYESSYSFNGHLHHYNVVISPVIGATNQHIGYCISANDITQKKMLELEREQMINDLLQRNKDLEQFAFIVSHNIRSPLANILGLSKLLEMGLKPDEATFALEGIATSAHKLDSVLGDLNVILQERRTVTEQKVMVNLNVLIREIISGLQTDIQKTNALIEYDFPQDASVLAIKSSLQTIFVNLITNSIKFAKPNERPEIRIWSEISGKEITIWFSDKGIGLDTEKFGEQLFGLYKRFNEHIEGKGVGLFMVKTQADILGAQIKIESKPNEGMTVTLKMPR